MKAPSLAAIRSDRTETLSAHRSWALPIKLPLNGEKPFLTNLFYKDNGSSQTRQATVTIFNFLCYATGNPTVLAT